MHAHIICLQHSSQCSDELDYSESQGSCAEVELPPPAGVCRECVGSRALVTMGDDVEALHLVKECRELERAFGTKFTEKLLKDGGDEVSKQQLEEIIFRIGRESLLASCEQGRRNRGG